MRPVILATLTALLSACAGGQIGSETPYNPSGGCGAGNNRACGGGL